MSESSSVEPTTQLISPASLSAEDCETETVLQLQASVLRDVFHQKYGYPQPTGPNPRLWHRFGYFLPDEYYEAMVAQLVSEQTMWLDVGCGRDIFPNNPVLAQRLAERCFRLVGLDPDANVEENWLVHERVRSTLDDYKPSQKFDLVTLRMVAEHLTDPQAAIRALARLTKPGGKVIVFTVYKWSPAALLAKLVPFRLHHCVKKVLWQTEERDTFSVAYQMNTRRRLAQLFRDGGFRESYFAYLADCRIFARFQRLHRWEIWLWRVLGKLGFSYPELCLLGVYERQPD